MKQTKFYIILLVFIITACNEYNYIPDDMKFMYKEGDTIIYKLDEYNIDTFVVTWLNTGYDVHDKQYYWEIQDVDVNYVGYDSIRLNHFINNSIQLTTSGFFVTWGDFSSATKSILHDSVKINGHFFKNVYERESDTSLWPTRNIYKIYFSRNYGVLKYWYRDQRAFEFYKDIVQ